MAMDTITIGIKELFTIFLMPEQSNPASFNNCSVVM